MAAGNTELLDPVVVELELSMAADWEVIIPMDGAEGTSWGLISEDGKPLFVEVDGPVVTISRPFMVEVDDEQFASFLGLDLPVEDPAEEYVFSRYAEGEDSAVVMERQINGVHLVPGALSDAVKKFDRASNVIEASLRNV